MAVSAASLSVGDIEMANTDGATREKGEVDAVALSRGRHSIWYTFTVPATAKYFFTTDGSDFDTTLAVYSNTGRNVSSAVQVCPTAGAGWQCSTFARVRVCPRIREAWIVPG